MAKKEQSMRKLYRRDEAIFEANEILKAKVPDAPLVLNVGRAALVLGLDASDLHPDYRPYEKRWIRIRAGSSFTVDDFLPFTIIAKEDQAFQIRKTREKVDLVEVIEATDRLWLGDPKARVQMTTVGAPVLIDGVQYPPITQKQYDVIYTLLRAGRRMTEDELKEESGYKDARGILNRMCDKMPHWKKVIIFPGNAHGGGYGIGQ